MNLLKEVFSLVYIIRALIGIFVAGGAAWGVAFFVADYISKANVETLSVAVQGLQSSVDTLNGSVHQVNNNLLTESRALRSEREALARDIAQEVVEIQKAQRVGDDALSNKISELVGQLTTTNGELKSLTNSIVTLNKSADNIDQRLTSSIERQRGFEQFVTSILLRQGPPPSKLNWYEPWGLKEAPKGTEILFMKEHDPKQVYNLLMQYADVSKRP